MNTPRRLRGVTIVGTDTGVGKTYQACELARALVARGWQVGAYKPVSSGCTPAGASDAELLRSATRSPYPLEKICPQNFRAPLAPPEAAILENRQVDERLLVDGALWWTEQCELLIVEGVGGAMSPISHSMTVLDLARELQLPVIVVAANRLGAISQILLAVEAILARGLSVAGIVLNKLPPEHARQPDADLACKTNARLLRRFVDDSLPVVDSVEHLLTQTAWLDCRSSRHLQSGYNQQG